MAFIHYCGCGRIRIVREGKPQEIANTIWAMAKLQNDAPVLAKAIDGKEVVERIVREGKPQDISNTIWAGASCCNVAIVHIYKARRAFWEKSFGKLLGKGSS